ncbi:MAG: DNA-3-methyladenine glycosylase 2 family protein [Defluviitaleaceae bacterium]|nr:DNA-3-methyladenine glycosylase 2 family protein [Defluviitaleaceae bacterium]
MDYTYAEQIGNDVKLTGVRHFDLAQTLDNGQAFRWREVTCGQFSGVAHGRRLVLLQNGDTVILKDVTLEQFESTWANYFDLRRDYGELRALLSNSANSETLCKALQFSTGLRLLHQDTWEILISFILSQNSNIPRIKKMIELLCQHFGMPLPCGGYTFPTPQALADLTPADLAPIKSGYRAAYIIDAAKHVATGKFDPTTLQSQPSEAIKQALIKIHGIGPKVAECVLLYGFNRIDRYPIDVWVKRIMSQLYPTGFPKEITNHAGIAQQYLFHYARNVKDFSQEI